MKQGRVKDTVRKYGRVQSSVRKHGKVKGSVRKHGRVKSSVRKCKIFIKPLKPIIYEMSKNSDNQRCITRLEADRHKTIYSVILRPCKELNTYFFLWGTWRYNAQTLLSPSLYNTRMFPNKNIH